MQCLVIMADELEIPRQAVTLFAWSTKKHVALQESWAPKNGCFWTVVLQKTLESPLDCKDIQPVHSEGDQLWDFFGRNDAKAETQILWSPHAKSWLIGKDPDAGRDWGQEEKGMTEDEMVGCHHWLDEHESEWTLGVGDGQGGLACCDSWGRKELDTTERLNWTALSWWWLSLNCSVLILFILPTLLSNTCSTTMLQIIWVILF